MLLRASSRAASCAVLVLLLGALVGCAGRGQVVPVTDASGRPSAASAADVRAARPAIRFAASDVLRDWDRARSRAFADGDAAALRSLYVPGTAAGRADVALLRAYQRRGLRVTGMEVQTLAVEVLHESPRALRVRVTDRITGAVAIARDGSATRLPRDTASTRVVELVRREGARRWRVSSVRE